jgi:hypothetical protein
MVTFPLSSARAYAQLADGWIVVRIATAVATSPSSSRPRDDSGDVGLGPVPAYLNFASIRGDGQFNADDRAWLPGDVGSRGVVDGPEVSAVGPAS